MKRTMGKRWTLGAWMLLLLLPGVAGAYSYVMMSDADLFDGAEGVIAARVERARPAQDGEGETRYELRVLRTLAGPRLTGNQVLVLPGTWDAPNRNLIIDGVPRLVSGGEILLFYTQRADGALEASQLSLGLFGRERVDGAAYYVRPLEGTRELSKHADTLRFHQPRHPAAFERWLVDRARGVQRAPDYLREAPVARAFSKFTFSTFGFNPAGPARWIQFDSDQTLVWRAGPEGQANTASDEFASVQQALAAWTNDPNSRILTTYAGTMANPVICNNPPQSGIGFAGHVCWNDPAGRIGGSFNCNGGGTLAIGGSFAGTPSHSVNGQLWYRRSDAFVVIQDGAGCFMDGDNGADGAELLTHEIGHSLAFGHACGDSESPACNSSAVLNQATMRAFAHGDGRGATLGEDDRAAAAMAYPMPNGGDVTAPTVPANLGASASGNAITVSWNASTDAGSGVAGYELERCQGAGCNNFAQITSGSGTSFMDTGLMTSTTYRYRVRAIDMAGNRSGYSGIATATTAAMMAMPLANGVPASGLSGALDSQRLFSLQVPAGATNLLFAISGGTGDADLYVRLGSPPTTSAFDCRPFLIGNNESCSTPTPNAGNYFVLIDADVAYSGVSLVGSFQVPGAEACTGNCIFRGGFEAE